MNDERESEIRALLARARAGERAAREDLLQRFLPSLRAFVRLRAGGAVRAKESESDLVQTVCLGLLEGLEGFEGTSTASFRAWLFQSAVRKIIDKARYYRAERRNPDREDEAAGGAEQLLGLYSGFCTPSRHAMAREEIARIEAAFDLLPDDYREVVSLACVAGLPHAEIAKSMGRSPEAVRQLLARARARLAILAMEE